jgi:hypothetical protein
MCDAAKIWNNAPDKKNIINIDNSQKASHFSFIAWIVLQNMCIWLKLKIKGVTEYFEIIKLVKSVNLKMCQRWFKKVRKEG